MSRRTAAALVALAATILVLAGIWSWRARRAGAPFVPPSSSESVAPPAAPAATSPSWSATLWLPGPAEKIAPLAVEITSPPDPHEKVIALLTALLAARPDPPLAALFPDSAVQLAAAVLVGDGTLYVDLRATGGDEEPPGAGSALELQRVYSIVHTVLHNEPEVARVVLLWNGVQRPSFEGHVDTGRPLVMWPAMERQ